MEAKLSSVAVVDTLALGVGTLHIITDHMQLVLSLFCM